jgi:LysR family transcriptional regulator, glycine cleavage system transcriptional activator
MSNRLPPLVWLRAFEAAGRLQSFRAAAEELHVSPSAISHHVRSLERRLGRPLFERTGVSVRLTREGEAYLARVTAGFVQLASAGDALEDGNAVRRLTIGAFPFLASEILVPNLADLRARLPRVALSVVSGTGLALLTHADPAQRVDAIIRYGSGRFPGCTARKLTDIELIPVASPALLAAAGAGSADALVAHGPRIAVAGPYDGWSAWTDATAVELVATAEVLTFDSYLSAMRAAEQGLGVGLGIRPFIDPWLDQGRLAVVVNLPAPAGQASYLVTAQYAGARAELDTLAAWLLARFGR